MRYCLRKLFLFSVAWSLNLFCGDSVAGADVHGGRVQSGRTYLVARDLGEKQSGRDETVENMVLIPESIFWMGCVDGSLPDALPLHQVHLKSFWIDRTEVTNAQFAQFVKETAYKTVAERKPESKDFPGVPEDKLVPGSLVFTPPKQAVSKKSHYVWWRYVPGACWNHPEGPGSDISTRMEHPVVHVAWEDACAYAAWAKKRLPTEAEFECAARAGLDRKKYSWGDEFKPAGIWQANIWQGTFPYQNTAEDGFAGTAPVASFPPNAYGLYDMTGNIWEWCSDWYRPDYYQSLPKDRVIDDPKGPEDSFDPVEPGTKKRVQSGGSFLCTDQYCVRYLAGARGKGEISSGCSNVGFRCVRDAD